MRKIIRLTEKEFRSFLRNVIEEVSGKYNVGPVYHCGSEISADKFKDVIWFSSEPLKEFGDVGKYMLEMKKPLVVPAVFDSWSERLWPYCCDDIAKPNKDPGSPELTKILPKELWEEVQLNEFEYEVGDIPYMVKYEVEEGNLDYDGVIIKGIGEGVAGWDVVDDYIVFSPSQVIKVG